MGSLSRATNKTTTSMRAPGLSLLAAVISVSFSDALSTLNGRVDEDHNAIVVEALRARSGRAFSWFSGTPSSPFAGMFPAATQPLAPAALGQQVLCRTPGGAFQDQHKEVSQVASLVVFLVASQVGLAREVSG